MRDPFGTRAHTGRPVRFRWLLLLALPLTACQSQPDELSLLTDWMTGSFSSAAQSAGDPDYYDIRLHMVPIWPDVDGGPWLYVEQASATRPGQPYRQRIYRLGRTAEGGFASYVYTFAQPERFAGAWRDPAALDALSPDELDLRDGCAVYLRHGRDGSFTGGTRETDCASSLRGATYATSEVVIRSDRIESWDRGFDAAGTQVWGAEKGPYLFSRHAAQ